MDGYVHQDEKCACSQNAMQFVASAFILNQVIAGPDGMDPRQDITYKPPEYTRQVSGLTSIDIL